MKSKFQWISQCKDWPIEWFFDWISDFPIQYMKIWLICLAVYVLIDVVLADGYIDFVLLLCLLSSSWSCCPHHCCMYCMVCSCMVCSCMVCCCMVCCCMVCCGICSTAYSAAWATIACFAACAAAVNCCLLKIYTNIALVVAITTCHASLVLKVHCCFCQQCDWLIFL